MLITFKQRNKTNIHLVVEEIEALTEFEFSTETPTKVIMKSGREYAVREPLRAAYVMFDDRLTMLRNAKIGKNEQNR